MGQATVRGGFDAFISQDVPNKSHPKAKYLKLWANERAAFIYMKSPAPRRATITSAILRVRVRGNLSSSRNIVAHRVMEQWGAKKVTWNDQPSLKANSGRTASTGAISDGQAIDIDVTPHVQVLANGGRHFGWKLTTPSTTEWKIYGFDAGENAPRLIVEWSDAPNEPTSLQPDGGDVGRAKPTLTFDYEDVSGATKLNAVRAQISTTKNGASPDFDSGAYTTTEPELDLSATDMPGGTFGGLSQGTKTYWRIRAQDKAGLWSPWSDWAEMTYRPKQGVTISNPGAAGYVEDNTPPIMWTPGGTQKFWQVRITRANDHSHVLYDTGKRKGAATSHDLPGGVLRYERTYAVNVRSWDNNDNRVASPGDPIFSYAWREFDVNHDETVDVVTNFTATPVDPTPWIDLEWHRASAPDSWTIMMDDEAIATEVQPEDTFVSGTKYKYRVYSARPGVLHRFNVRAVINRKRSPKGTDRYATSSPQGIWIVDLDRKINVTLFDQDEGSFEVLEEAAVYSPLGASQPVRIVTSMGGLSGTLSGLLMEVDSLLPNKSLPDQLRDLYRIKARPTEAVRIIIADENIRARIGNIKVEPTVYTRRRQRVKRVTFDFWQIGDLPYEPRI